MKVAFCASEAVPLAKTGGLADVIGALPAALKETGVAADIYLPFYGSIKNSGIALTAIGKDVFKSSLKGCDIYLIEHEAYFGRDGIYGDKKGVFEDNGQRYQFFSLRILELFKELNIRYDIVHCHDWHTAIIPVYLKYRYARDEFYARMKTVLTIHNLAFQGVFSISEFDCLGLEDDILEKAGFDFYGQINWMKAGIKNADMVTTVSPQYAKEIQTEEFGCGLDKELSGLKIPVKGILNGIDYAVWNPAQDSLLAYPYSADNFESIKIQNKVALQKQLGLAKDESQTLFGFVGRLAHQKGIDVFVQALKGFKGNSCQVVIQGVGDAGYEQLIREVSGENKDFMAASFDFNERLAHQIYAGSDFFLMPSLFEPCGLSQMISLAYGTIPLVARVGGLIDSVISFEKDRACGNGLNFESDDAKDLTHAMHKALSLYKNKTDMAAIIHNAFKSRFSWAKSAGEYKESYLCL